MSPEQTSSQARAGRWSHRRLLAGRHALRVADLAAGVRRRSRGGAAASGEHGADRAATAQPVGPARPGDHRAEGDGKKPGRPLSHGGRAGGRALRRFLAGEPILARPLGAIERCRRWCKCNPIVAGLTGAVALSLLVGSVVSTYFAIQAVDRAAEAIRERDRAEANEKRIRQEKRLADRHLYVAQMNLVQQGWERRPHRPSAAALARAGADAGRGGPARLRLALLPAALSARPAALAGPRARRQLPRLCPGRKKPGQRWTRWPHPPLGPCRQADPDLPRPSGTDSRHRLAAAGGKTLASASHDRTVKLWDVASGTETRTIADRRAGAMRRLGGGRPAGLRHRSEQPAPVRR